MGGAQIRVKVKKKTRAKETASVKKKKAGKVTGKRRRAGHVVGEQRVRAMGTAKSGEKCQKKGLPR